MPSGLQGPIESLGLLQRVGMTDLFRQQKSNRTRQRANLNYKANDPTDDNIYLRDVCVPIDHL